VFTARLLLFSLLALGCGPPPAVPNLVLIAVDTLRADHMGIYGYARPTSPIMDRLGETGTTFTQAFAPSSWTKPSIGSLFTSRLPSEHGATAFARHLDASLPTLAELLRERGYHTLGVAGNFVHLNEETGMNRGFDEWRTLSRVRENVDGEPWEHPDGRPIALSAPSAGEVNAEVLAHLPSPAAGAEPLFLYVHYMEPHAEYDPPAGLRERFATDPGAHAERSDAGPDYLVDLARDKRRADARERQRLIDLYDAEISAVDSAIGALLAELRERGLMREAVIVIVSDHGEEFDEHGSWFHGISLQTESVHVPLLLHDTRNPGGVRRDEPVDLLDVPTTLLAFAGVEPAAGMRGRDLRAEALSEREFVAQLHSDPIFEARVARQQLFSVTRWPWKAIATRDGARTAFRLDRDPAEREPLEFDSAPLVLHGAMDGWAERMAANSDADAQPLDAQTREGLRALGYAE
jgi:arylsulfatase A-like enzyme